MPSHNVEIGVLAYKKPEIKHISLREFHSQKSVVKIQYVQMSALVYGTRNCCTALVLLDCLVKYVASCSQM